jgi:hypothetical protein
MKLNLSSNEASQSMPRNWRKNNDLCSKRIFEHALQLYKKQSERHRQKLLTRSSNGDVIIKEPQMLARYPSIFQIRQLSSASICLIS